MTQAVAPPRGEARNDLEIALVVPFPPGGANDTIGRLVADKLGKRLGQTIVVEYRPGAGGSISAAQVANARPDGQADVR